MFARAWILRRGGWLDANAASRFLKSPANRRLIFGNASCEPILAECSEAEAAIAQYTKQLQDPSMKDLSELIREDIDAEEKRFKAKQEQLRQLVLFAMNEEGRFDEDKLNARLEIRAGVGGEEAAKWASELFDLYAAVSAQMGWDFAPVSGNTSGLPGSETVFQALVQGGNGDFLGPFGWLKFESGVHRVQRIPYNSDRMQTSAAGVWVMPQVEVAPVMIRQSDLKVHISKKSSGAGGQSVNAAYQQVRMTHIPSGFSVTVNESHAQQENREMALERIETHLKRMAEEKVVGQLTRNRKSQIKTADRSEKIRTYNFPRNEINDHRVSGLVVKESVENFLTNPDSLIGIWDPLRVANENLRINEYICQKIP